MMRNSADRFIEIDERLPGVPGLINVIRRPAQIQEDIESAEVEEFTDFEDNDVIDNVVETPEFLGVVDRSYRYSSDGTMVVDITVEVDDIEGADGYEVQVSL